MKARVRLCVPIHIWRWSGYRRTPRYPTWIHKRCPHPALPALLNLTLELTNSATPMHDGPAEELQHTLDASFETHAQSQAQAQTRSANVQTLQQMFPALDEEVLEAVLQGSEEDLGLAIDRLLEM